MDTLSFLAILVLLVLILRLNHRVKNLEATLQRQPTASVTPPPASATPSIAAAPAPVSPASVPLPAATPFYKPAPDVADLLEKFIKWIKEDWLLKLGALLLLIGFGWFVTYAFLHNWIGPIGRITVGLIAGVLIMLLGWWRIKRFQHQGEVFLVLGSTTILLTTFAARELYDFFNPLAALTVMFMSAAFVALSSVKFQSRALAISSIILAGFAPLLTNSPAPDYISLFSYLLVVLAGTVWIVLLTGWRSLTLVALVVYALYSLSVMANHRLDNDIFLLFAYAFAAIFFLTDAFGIIKAKAKDIVPNLITAGGSGLLLLGWILSRAPQEWQSLIIAAWMVVFAVGAFLLFRVTAKREPFFVYAGVSLVMLAAATAAELSGAALTIAFTIEAAVTILIAHAVLKDLAITRRLSLLLAIPMFMSLESTASYRWHQLPLLNDHFFVMLILACVLGALGIFIREQQLKKSDPKETWFPALLLVISSVYFYRLLWLSLHLLIVNDDTAVTVALFIYTVIGLAAYLWGQFKEIKPWIWYGGAMLGLVVGRLLLVEVWQMALAWRIVTFFVTGALLAGTAFIGRRWHNQPPSTS